MRDVEVENKKKRAMVFGDHEMFHLDWWRGNQDRGVAAVSTDLSFNGSHEEPITKGHASSLTTLAPPLQTHSAPLSFLVDSPLTKLVTLFVPLWDTLTFAVPHF